MAIITLGDIHPDPSKIERAKPETVRARAVPALPASARVAGRQSLDRADDFMRSGLEFAMRLSADELWRDKKLDDRTLDRITIADLVELLCDVSPEVGKAVWDFLRLGNPGWEYKVLSPQADDDTEDAAGKAVIDGFVERLKERHGSLNVAINRMFLSAFIRGAVAAELVFDLDRRTPYELATPDPNSFRFRRVPDPVLRTRWQIGQFQGRDFVPLDLPTIRYIPIDPLPGRPEGRAPVGAALYGAIFLLGLLHDVRRVVSQQGWPRLDLEVQLQAIADSLPETVVDDPEQFAKHVDDAIKQVTKIYAALEPDDTYVHTNVVKVNRPVGTVDSDSLGGVDKLIVTVERLTVRGLKSIPLLHGSTEGTSEANANRQWEIHVAGIKSIQHLVESCLESLLGLALRASGIQARVDWKFAELRAAEMLRDAQTEKLRIDNETRKYNQGWTTQDEGALAITGHVAVEKEPRNPIMAMAGINGGGNPATAQPDPGANRFLESVRNAAAMSLLLTTPLTEPSAREVADAEQYWRDNAVEEAQDLIDAETID